MKLPFVLSLFAGVLLLASGTTLPAQTTNTPATNAAPAITPNVELDKESGKPIVTTPSGLKYVDVTVGTGAALKTGDHLIINYEGKLADGSKFDSSYDRGKPFDLVLGVTSVIRGWNEGLATMKVGGTRKLIIPPQLGYGTGGYGDVIPPNATLTFTVEVVSVKSN